jgi:hypothetical protein
MSQDPVHDYKVAKEQFDEAYNKLVRIRRIITDTSQSLQHPYEFMVTGTDVVFPSEVGLVRTPTLFASDWPSAKQIAQSLVALHQAYRLAKNAWSNLSQTDRANVEKLPDET